MRNFPADWDPEVDYKDVESVNFWKKMKELHPDGSEALQEARILLQKKARDHARTPMQWDSTPHAGFTVPEATPWMRVNDDYRVVNVEAQTNVDSQRDGVLSVWQYWQQALRLRKQHQDVFVYGDFEHVDHDNEKVFAYLRIDAKKAEKWLVVMNWTTEEVEWTIPAGIYVRNWVSSLQSPVSSASTASIKLQALEGVLGVCN